MSGAPIIDISVLCRSCMKKIHSGDEKNFDDITVQMFCFCTNVKIRDDDGLPRQFCTECYIKINDFFSFTKEAKATNVMLEKIVSGDEKVLRKLVTVEEVVKKLILINPHLKIEHKVKQPETDTVKSLTSITNNQIKRNNFNFENELVKADESSLDDEEFKEEYLEISDDDYSISDEYKSSTEAAMNELNSDPEDLVECNPKVPDVQDFIDTAPGVQSRQNKYKTNQNTNEDKEQKVYIINIPKTQENSNRNNNKAAFTSTALLLNTGRRKAKIGNETNERYKCEMCTRTFKFVNCLQNHIDSDHSGDQFACAVCDKTFLKRHLLNAHYRVHSEARFECDICGSRFKAKSRLTTHKKTHSNELNYMCNECGKRFKLKDGLRVHLLSHSEGKHVCEVCGRSYISNSMLLDHLNTHTGVKAFKCPACSYRGMTMYALRGHMGRCKNVLAA